ncbi:MAG: hypothetical protein SF097_27300 [Acidobacteriota bacterium]|nr:hypothetical protein [Acidobacteriota bacterium]
MMVLLTIFGFCSCGKAQEKKNIEHRLPNPLPLTLVELNAPLEQIRQIVIELFADRVQHSNPNFDGATAYTKDDQIFQSDAELKLNGRLDTIKNEPLSRYLAIDPSLRTRDLYLWYVSGEKYWESEYYWNDKPAKFSSNFIIHFEAKGKNKTSVEAIQFQPTIWVGDVFSPNAHGPGWSYHYDIRFVEPTVKDSADLVKLIEQAVTQQGKNPNK